MVQLQELPKSTTVLEDWLWDYMTGKVTQPMVDRIARNLTPVLRGKCASEFGEEIAEKIQTLSAKEFSDWVISKS